MGLDLRTVRDEEIDDFLRGVTTGFGMTSPAEDDEYPVHLLPAERCLTVRDDETIVATAGAIPFRLIVPGGAQVAVAGVSTLTVHPTHRRRGLLRRMMDEQLDDIARRHEPLAARRPLLRRAPVAVVDDALLMQDERGRQSCAIFAGCGEERAGSEWQVSRWRP